jgi:hypothetical protein
LISARKLPFLTAWSDAECGFWFKYGRQSASFWKKLMSGFRYWLPKKGQA